MERRIDSKRCRQPVVALRYPVRALEGTTVWDGGEHKCLGIELLTGLLGTREAALPVLPERSSGLEVESDPTLLVGLQVALGQTVRRLADRPAQPHRLPALGERNRRPAKCTQL